MKIYKEYRISSENFIPYKSQSSSARATLSFAPANVFPLAKWASRFSARQRDLRRQVAMIFRLARFVWPVPRWDDRDLMSVRRFSPSNRRNEF